MTSYSRWNRNGGLPRRPSLPKVPCTQPNALLPILLSWHIPLVCRYTKSTSRTTPYSAKGSHSSFSGFGKTRSCRAYQQEPRQDCCACKDSSGLGWIGLNRLCLLRYHCHSRAYPQGGPRNPEPYSFVAFCLPIVAGLATFCFTEQRVCRGVPG